MLKARRDAVAHFADFVDHQITLTLFHRHLRAVLGASPAPAQTAQAARSRGEYGQTCSRLPGGGNSKSPESRTGDNRPAPGVVHPHRDRRASPCAGRTPARSLWPASSSKVSLGGTREPLRAGNEPGGLRAVLWRVRWNAGILRRPRLSRSGPCERRPAPIASRSGPGRARNAPVYHRWASCNVSPRWFPVPGCNSSASMVCSHPTPRCVPRSLHPRGAKRQPDRPSAQCGRNRSASRNPSGPPGLPRHPRRHVSGPRHDPACADVQERP